MKHIKNILFDCDGVLYQDLEAVFGQVSKRMTQYISKKLRIDLKEAKELQTNYFHKYNTSLNGLMIHHDIPPTEFLQFVHDIDLSFMEKDLVLREEIKKLDLRKFVFTNGSKEHVKNITTHLGIDDLFDDVFDIVNSLFDIAPKVLTEQGKAKNPWPNVDAASGSLLYHYGLKEFNFYTVLFSISRSMGMIAQMVWERALGIPITRPKSVTTDWIKENS